MEQLRRKSFLTIISILILCFGIVQVIPAQYTLPQIASEELRIGVFDIDATPPIGSHLAYNIMFNSDDLGLRAKGIVLVGARKPIVLCAIDWIGIANESQDVFKQALAEAAGTTSDRVAVHTIHQHDAPRCDYTAEKLLYENNIPVGSFDGTFSRKLIKEIQRAIIKSIGELQPVTEIGLGKAPIYKVASNRRVDKVEGKVKKMRASACNDSLLIALPEGLIDPDVSLISFWNNDKPLAVLSFYATHPQSYYRTGIANPDFPGIARYLRQLAIPGALHVHFNGAGGNVAAGKYNDGSRENRFILAERMADGMKRAWDNTEKYPISSENVQWETKPVLLPANPKMADIEKELPTGVGLLGWYKRALEGKTIDFGCLSINKARIFFMPGELFVEYQLAAKKMAPDKFVAMAAYGDYGTGYIGTKTAYDEGGYEIQVSAVSEDAETVILNAIQMLHQQVE